MMKVYILAAGVLANVCAAALGARPIKNDKWEGIVTHGRRTQDDLFACQAEATAFGLCIDPSVESASCLYDPIMASFDVVMDDCTTEKVESLCSSAYGCGWYTSCVDEWQAFANCYLMELQCLDTCSMASDAGSPTGSPTVVENSTGSPTDVVITGPLTGSPTVVEISTETPTDVVIAGSPTGSPTAASTGHTSRPVSMVVGGLIAALIVFLGEN
jgi:hypothetical protein